MAELADATDSKSVDRKIMRVRLPPWPPHVFMKKVLVTGAGGFIGSHMSKFLKDRGYYVIALDKDFPEVRNTLFSRADEIITHDLREQIVPDKALDVDWVFHYAADMGGVGYFFSDADGKASADNMRIDLNILQAVKSNQRLFYASSFCAYPIEQQVLLNGRAKRAMQESDFGGAPAEQIYGEEKRFMTILCEDARKTQARDIRVGIFSTIYGPGQEMMDEMRSKFPTAIIKKTLDAQKNGTPIEVWGDGTQVRTFLYIDDAIEKMYKVMSADTYEGPVNIGSDEQVTVKEMADYVCELVGIEPNYSFNLEKPTGVMGKDTDNSKFNKLYGKSTQTPAREGFKKVYEWYVEYLKQNQQQL